MSRALRIWPPQRWQLAAGWLGDLSPWVQGLIWEHRAMGLFLVILVEEMGVPLPFPGDIAIALGGYLTAEGQLNHFLAYACVVAGATLGSTVLFTLSRHFGRPFVLRVGRLAGIDERRLARAERGFRRWGTLAIIVGRLIPGLRIVLTAAAGVFEMPYRTFVPSVMLSSAIWAAIYIELGRHLGRRTLDLARLLPTAAIPWAILGIGVVLITHLAWSWRPSALRNAKLAKAPNPARRSKKT